MLWLVTLSTDDNVEIFATYAEAQAYAIQEVGKLVEDPGYAPKEGPDYVINRIELGGNDET